MALDFPANPTQGQTYNNFYYDSTTGAWRSLSSVYSPNALRNSTITTSSAAGVPLTIQGYASQSANLQEWKNSSGTVLSSINSSGNISTPVISTTTSAYLRDVHIDRDDSNLEGGQISLRRSTDNADYWFIDVYGNTSTPSLRFFNASQPTPAMIMDSSNQIRMPYQPAFFAYGSGTQSFSGTYVDTKVNITNGTFLNRGNNFALASARFTAPVSGVYLFFAYATASVNNTGPELKLFKNGSLLNLMGINYDTSTYTTWGQSVPISLTANDYVELYCANNNSTSFTLDLSRTYFGGYFVG